MKPTRAADLAGVAAVAGVAGWLVVRIAYGRLPALPLGLALTFLLLAIAEVGLAVVLRGQIERRRDARVLDPLLAARSAALAKASSFAGALLGGLWAGLLVYLVSNGDRLSSAARETPATVTAVVAAAALVGAGLYLERALRTPGRTEDDLG